MGSIVVIEPNCAPELHDWNGEFSELQHIIGGYITTVQLNYGATMLVDEEGPVKQSPPNILFECQPIVGTVIIVGTKWDCENDTWAFCGLNPMQVSRYLSPNKFVRLIGGDK